MMKKRRKGRREIHPIKKRVGEIRGKDIPSSRGRGNRRSDVAQGPIKKKRYKEIGGGVLRFERIKGEKGKPGGALFRTQRIVQKCARGSVSYASYKLQEKGKKWQGIGWE